MDRFPALFVSHGSPMIAITPNPAHHFLRDLGPRLGRPRAILIATAHWATATPVLGTAARPETIHDFGGFPPALYALRYPAPGAPEVAREAGTRLRAAGLAVAEDAARGLDHGSWIPALLMYPDADIPIAQISIQPEADPAHHYQIGAALRPLREEGVLILGSGSFTHNLRAAFGLMRGVGRRRRNFRLPRPSSPGSARKWRRATFPPCSPIANRRRTGRKTTRRMSIFCRFSPPSAPRHRGRSANAGITAPIMVSRWMRMRSPEGAGAAMAPGYQSRPESRSLR